MHGPPAHFGVRVEFPNEARFGRAADTIFEGASRRLRVPEFFGATGLQAVFCSTRAIDPGWLALAAPGLLSGKADEICSA